MEYIPGANVRIQLPTDGPPITIPFPSRSVSSSTFPKISKNPIDLAHVVKNSE